MYSLTCQVCTLQAAVAVAGCTSVPSVACTALRALPNAARACTRVCALYGTATTPPAGSSGACSLAPTVAQAFCRQMPHSSLPCADPLFCARTLCTLLCSLEKGTTYNAYLIYGETHTALVDASHEKFSNLFISTLQEQLKAAGRKIDYVLVSLLRSLALGLGLCIWSGNAVFGLSSRRTGHFSEHAAWPPEFV